MDPIITLPAVLALGAVVGHAVSRRRDRKKRALEAMREVDVPGTQRDVAVLVALGHDPARHRIQPVHHPVKGLRIVDFVNRPVAFHSLAQMRKPKFQKAYHEAMRQTSVTV